MVSYLTTLFLGKSPEVNLPVHNNDNNNKNNNNNISLFREDNILSIAYLTYGP